MRQLVQVRDGPPRILVLEDEKELREALLLLLQEEGYQVESAAQAQEAFHKALQMAPEILVLDVRLPGPDGLEVLEQLKESNPELLSLVVTGYASEADSVRAIRLGVGDYLKKPFSMSGFLAALEGLVRISLGKRELRRRKEAGQQLASWTLHQLSGAQDLSPHGRRWSWREVGLRAYEAARGLGMSDEVARTTKTAVLFSLLHRYGELSAQEDLLEQTLPSEVLQLAQGLECASPDEISPESLAWYAVKLATLAEDEEFRGLANEALEDAFHQKSPSGESAFSTTAFESTLLGLAKTLAASGDLKGAEDALFRLVESAGNTRWRGEGYLQLAVIHARSGRRAEAQRCLAAVTTLLSKLGLQQAAELALEAGLVAIRLRFSEGKTLLARSAKGLEQLGSTGQHARARLALWCLGEEDEQFRDQALNDLAGPHRHDLLVSCGSWLLPALLRSLPDLDLSLHKRVVHRLVRECPSTVRHFASRTLEERPLTLLIDALEETEVGLEEVAGTLTRESYPEKIRTRVARAKGGDSPRKTPVLRLCSLGIFEVAAGDAGIDAAAWRTQKARFLLACLGARGGRPVANEILIEQFWPTATPERGIKNLYQAASDVRKVLAPALGAKEDPLTRSGAALGISDSLEVWHDVSEFQRAIEDGERFWETGDLEKAREFWKEAVRLHRGRYLEDCPMEWAEQSRRQYALMYEKLLERLAEVCLKLGHHRETVELAGQLLQLDACHQNAHQLAMEAYIGEGRPEEAVRQFERLRVTLWSEFGAEPSIDCLRTLQKAKLLM